MEHLWNGLLLSPFIVLEGSMQLLQVEELAVVPANSKAQEP